MVSDDDPRSKVLKRQPLFVAGDRPLVNLTPKVVEAIDAQMSIVGDYGYVTLKVAHGRVAGFETLRSTRVLDELVGQGVPKEKRGVA